MKYIYLMTTLLGLTFVINGCGGGGGSSDATFGTGSNQIIVIDCDNTNNATATNDCGNALTPDYYSCIQPADTLVSDSDNTQYQIIDDSNGTKKVCVQTTTPRGAAHILRGN